MSNRKPITLLLSIEFAGDDWDAAERRLVALMHGEPGGDGDPDVLSYVAYRESPSGKIIGPAILETFDGEPAAEIET